MASGILYSDACAMIISNIDREAELRAHIHSLLQKYALTHLATDHVSWTEGSVANCFSKYLHSIPTTDPTSVALPVDPFEVLSRRWNIFTLDVYEERWRVRDEEAVAYLKRQVGSLARQSNMAEQYWRDNDDAAYDAFLLERPMSPVLTSRATRETPKCGSGAFLAKLPQESDDIPRRYGVNMAQEVVPEDALVDLDDALSNKLNINAETHRRVVGLLGTVPTLTKVSKPSTTHHVDGFLRSDSPPPYIPESEMLPVFPRSERTGSSILSDRSPSFMTMNSMAQLPSAILPAVMREEDEEDLADEHLVVIDGWQTFRTSSPSTAGTPSLADSSSEIDELFMPSSPTCGILGADQLFMEEYEMPRSKRVGGARGKPPLVGQGNKLSEFLSPLIRPSQSCAPRIVQSPRSQPSSPRTTISASMLGQPPSPNNVPEPIANLSSDADNPSSDGAIAHAIKAVEHACGDRLGSEDPTHLILREKLDDKDGLLMDVPALRPPNEHPVGNLTMPSRLADLLASTTPGICKSVTEGGARKIVTGGLKKAKGLQPLQIELSWVPFKYGRTVPTDEEVADVQNDPCPQLAKAIDLAQDDIVSRLTALLDESMAFGSQPIAAESMPSSTVWSLEEDGGSPTAAPDDFGQEQVLTLTRRDRRCLAGLTTFSNPPSPAVGGAEGRLTPEGDRVTGTVSDTSEPYEESGRPMKRVRFADSVVGEQSASCGDTASCVEESQIDDSGIYFYDSGITAGGHQDYLRETLEHNTAEMVQGDLPFDSSVHSGDYRLDEASHRNLRSLYPSRPDCADSSSSSFDGRGPTADTRHMFSESIVLAEEEQPFAQPATHDHRTFLPPIPASFLAITDVAAAPDPAQTHRNSVNVSPVLPIGPGTFGSTAEKENPPSNSARQSLAEFLAFCGKRTRDDSAGALHALLSLPDAATSDLAVTEVQIAPPGPPVSVARETPLELVDDSTLTLPAQHVSPSNGHRYMTSMDLVQKRALVRALSSLCMVDLVEREHLGLDGEEVHLVLDCDTAVLFASIEALPSRGNTLAASLTRLSWRFSRMLVVFECYPSSWNYKGDQDFADRQVASVWSPPTVKAIRKLRRDLGIAEGMQTKRVAAITQYAFANSAKEAAIFARMFGDACAARDDKGGLIWGERLWLTHEERDGEYDLCQVDGMNLFAASLLLSHATLEDFLEMNADERMLEFGDLVGVERITRFNVEMARRLEIMQLPPSSPVSGDASSSINTIPYIGDSELDMY